jgi:hypothetical protein
VTVHSGYKHFVRRVENRGTIEKARLSCTSQGAPVQNRGHLFEIEQ